MLFEVVLPIQIAFTFCTLNQGLWLREPLIPIQQSESSADGEVVPRIQEISLLHLVSACPHRPTGGHQQPSVRLLAGRAVVLHLELGVGWNRRRLPWVNLSFL